MVFQLPTVARLAGTLTLCLVVLSARAQGVVPVASPESPGEEHHLDINRQIQAPQNLFGPSVDDAMAPPLAPPVNTLQQMVKDKPNWTQMTPDEILGVQTDSKEQEAKTAAARRLASGQSPLNQSALENFLMNRRLAETGSTNLNNYSDGGSFLDPATGLADPRRAAALQAGPVIHSSLFNRLLENAHDSFNSANQANPDADWARIFTAPATTGPTPAQQAEMTAFQQLLQPSAPAPADKTSFGFPQPAPLLDPNLEPRPAGYNPAGSTFAPLDSGIGRPKRVSAMPTATTMPSVPSPTPSWAPQPPPWTIKGPQLFVEPVRQF